MPAIRKAIPHLRDSRPWNAELTWKGRPQSIRWRCSADGQQLWLELIDTATRIAMAASAVLPGWICAEDELVIRSTALARVLAHAGIVDEQTTSLAGADGFVLARITASALRAMPSTLMEGIH